MIEDADDNDSNDENDNKDHRDGNTVNIHVVDLDDDKYDGHIDDNIKCNKVMMMTMMMTTTKTMMMTLTAMIPMNHKINDV